LRFNQPVHLDMEAPAGTFLRHSRIELVGAGGRDVDGVLEPLASHGPSHVVPAARVGRRLNVDVVVAVDAARVSGRGVIVRVAFAPGVVVLELHLAGNGGGGARFSSRV